MNYARCLLGSLTLATLSHAKPPANLQERVDAFAKGQPGGVALVWVDADGPVYCSSGHFSEKDPRSVTADTQFELGSVSKVFTALLLAESERLGKVSRNDSAAKFLLPSDDSAQSSLAGITLSSLSTHSAGLPRLPFNIGPNPDSNPDPYAAYGRTALLEALRVHGSTAPVGRSMAYSNFGVAVLGEALGAVWGESYAQALQEHVLNPLGMRATSVGLVGQPAPAELAPAHVDGSPVPTWTWQAFAPAGGLRSSARDLASLLSACISTTDTPLHEAVLATVQPQRAADELGGQIGLGWFLSEIPSVPLAWHNGATAGSHSFVAFDRKAHRGLAILSNSSKSSDELGFSLLGGSAPRPAPATVQEPEAYLGRYPLSPNFALDITSSKGALFVQATGQSKFPVFASARDKFFYKVVDAQLSFERDDTGKVVRVVPHQNGRDLPGIKASK